MGGGRPGVEVRRYKSGRAAIRIGFFFRGVRCRETLALEPTKRNLTYAANLRAEIQRQIEIGQFRYTDYFPDSPRARVFGHQVSTITVGQALTEWLEDAKRTKAHSTWKSYRTAVRGWLMPHLGDIRLTDLKPAHIRAMIRSCPAKAKSIRNILLPLRGVIKQAMADDLLVSDPMSNVDVDALVSREQKRSEYEVDPFAADELARLLDAAGRLFGPNGRNMIEFHAFTGLRTGELFGLTWEQVSAGEIRIDRSLVHGKDALTKTKAGDRTVPLTGAAALALKRQKAVTALAGGRVFKALGQDRWPYDYWRHYSAPFKRACQLAEVRYRNPYQLRHTFASQMLSGGENPLMVAKIMGHKDTQMLFRVYAKWIDQGVSFVSSWAGSAPLKSRADVDAG